MDVVVDVDGLFYILDLPKNSGPPKGVRSQKQESEKAGVVVDRLFGITSTIRYSDFRLLLTLTSPDYRLTLFCWFASFL